MKRFLMFPLVLGIVSALWMPLSLFEARAGTWLNTLRLNPEDIVDAVIFMMSPAEGEKEGLFVLFIFGFIIGLLLVISDWFDKRRDPVFLLHFVPNVCWLFCYQIPFVLADELLFWWLLQRARQLRIEPNSLISVLAYAIPLFTNLLVVVFAIILTFHDSRVLAPRVLRGKLRERARLE